MPSLPATASREVAAGTSSAVRTAGLSAVSSAVNRSVVSALAGVVSSAVRTAASSTAAAVRALGELVVPPRCALCPAGTAALCGSCLREVAPSGRPHLAWPQPVPPGFPMTWVAGPLTPPLSAALTAYKDRDRRDLGPVLARLLCTSVRAATASGSGVIWLVPVPGSVRAARRRGDRPLEGVALGAAEFLPGPVRVVRALTTTRAVRDQSLLDHAGRAANLAGALAVRPQALAGFRAGDVVVIVDDIVTSGATLAEAARAVRATGIDCVAACIAATGRRHPMALIAGSGVGRDGGGVVGAVEAG